MTPAHCLGRSWERYTRNLQLAQVRRAATVLAVQDARQWAIDACEHDESAWTLQSGQPLPEFLAALDALEAALSGGEIAA